MIVKLYDAEDDVALLAEWSDHYGVLLSFKGPYNDEFQVGDVDKELLYKFCKQFIRKVDGKVKQ